MFAQTEIRIRNNKYLILKSSLLNIFNVYSFSVDFDVYYPNSCYHSILFSLFLHSFLDEDHSQNVVNHAASEKMRTNTL